MCFTVIVIATMLQYPTLGLKHDSQRFKSEDEGNAIL